MKWIWNRRDYESLRRRVPPTVCVLPENVCGYALFETDSHNLTERVCRVEHEKKSIYEVQKTSIRFSFYTPYTITMNLVFVNGQFVPQLVRPSHILPPHYDEGDVDMFSDDIPELEIEDHQQVLLNMVQKVCTGFRLFKTHLI
jgi:hypothetical protein